MTPHHLAYLKQSTCCTFGVKLSYFLFSWLGLLFWPGILLATPNTSSAPVEIPLSILYSTDISGEIRRFQCRERGTSWQQQIDMANHLYQVQQLRQKHRQEGLPAPLLFNTGDNLAPAIASRFLVDFEGIAGIDAIADVFGRFQFDLIGLGNHEFSVPPDKLYSFLRRTQTLGIPFTAANLKVERLHPLFVLINRNTNNRPQRYFIFERTYRGQTIRIGVFHLITQKTGANPDHLKGITFEDPGTTTQSILEEINKLQPPVDLVIALSHLERGDQTKGSEIKQLADGADGIHLVISNDFRDQNNHLKVHTYVTQERTVYLVGGARYGSLLGHLQLRIQKKAGEKAKLLSMHIQSIAPAQEKYDHALRRELVKWEVAYCNAWGKPLGRGVIRDPEGMTFDQFRKYVLNYMRYLSRSEIAFLNQGALRSGGDTRFPLKQFITRDDIYQSMPFDNTMYIFRLRGSELSDFLSSSSYDNEALIFEGWDSGSSQVNGRAVENDKYYTVVTNAYLAQKRLRALEDEVKQQKAEVARLRKDKTGGNLSESQKQLSVKQEKYAALQAAMRRLRYEDCAPEKGESCYPRIRSSLIHHFASNAFQDLPPSPPPPPKKESTDTTSTDTTKKSKPKPPPPPPEPFGPYEIPYTAEFYRLSDWPSWKFDSLINLGFNAIFVSPVNLETYGEIGAGDPFREYSGRGQLQLNFEVGNPRHVWFNELNLLYGIYFRSAWDRSRTASISNPEQQVTNVVDEKDDEVRFTTGYKLRGWDRASIFLKYVLLTEFSLRRRPDLSDEAYIQQFKEVRYRLFQMLPELGMDFTAYKAKDGGSTELKFSFSLYWRKEFALQMTPDPESGRFKQMQQRGEVLRLPDTNHYLGFSVGYQLSDLVLASIGTRNFTFTSKGLYKLAFSITPNLPQQALLLTHEINFEATFKFALTTFISFDLGVVVYVLRGTLQKTIQEGSATVDPNLRIQGPWAFRITPNASLTFRWGARGQSF